MELSKKSELTLGSASYVISTELSGEASPSDRDARPHRGRRSRPPSRPGYLRAESQSFKTARKCSPGWKRSTKSVVDGAQGGQDHRCVDDATVEWCRPVARRDRASAQRETDALQHAIAQLGTANFEKATAALRAVLETYPNCSEARELLEIAYKASSGARLSIDVDAGAEAGYGSVLGRQTTRSD